MKVGKFVLIPKVLSADMVVGNKGDIRVDIRPIRADETVPLRHTVLWPNHPISHVLLPEDDAGYHYGAFISSHSEELPVAVISVFKEPFPPGIDLALDASSKQSARFRKFACDVAFQGQGIGTKLLKHVFGIARSELGCDSVWCDARLSSADWYERRGMIIVGDTFFKSEVEYVCMRISV